MEERPSQAEGGPGKDLNSITDKEIIEVRIAFDNLAWTLFDKRLTGQQDRILRIDYLNLFLIESYNWFATEGLASIFENRELVLPNNGVIRLFDHRLDRPRQDVRGNTGNPLWPNEARLDKMDYSGTLFVRAEITWGENSGKRGTKGDLGQINLGKIPIMVGSSFCNLSTITNQRDLVRVQECSADYMGYFIIKGNEKVLIGQNYLKANDTVCILSKMGTLSYSKTTCNIRSRGSDGMMIMHKVYIMTDSSNKVKHSDRRIYIQMPWIKKNLYDASKTIVGGNLVTIFRMAVALSHYINPMTPIDYYLFADLPGDEQRGLTPRRAGVDQVSTFDEASLLFRTMIQETAGEKLWKEIQNYIIDTVNEASLEADDEFVFWKQLFEMSQDPNAKREDVATAESSLPILITFSNQFLPHMSNTPFSAQWRELQLLRSLLREKIDDMHQKKLGTNYTRDTMDYDINSSLFYLGQLRAIYKPENPNDEAYIRARDTLYQDRGVTLSDEYENALVLYQEIYRDIHARLRLTAYMAVRVLRVELGIDTYDDRDSLANQMYEHAGILMASRFVSMLKELEDALKKVDKSADVTTIAGAMATKGKAIITDGFSSNFSLGDWNARTATKTRTGVTDILPSSITVARVSYLRRVSANSKAHSKNTQSRELTGLQNGAICLSETPEGQQCGNVEHLASAAFLTNESADTQTLAYRLVELKTSRRRDPVAIVKSMRERAMDTKYIPEDLAKQRDDKGQFLISGGRRPDRDTIAFFNGKPIGWVDGLKFRKYLVDLRRAGYIHPHTGIHYTQHPTRTGIVKELKIETTGGRIVQPLIIAEDPVRTVNILWALISSDPSARGTTIADLIEYGFIEFIDSAELEFLDLAPSVDIYLKSIQNGLPRRFDHIMLNPAFLMGSAANVMPFADMNPVVRNSYFTQMVKQPVVVPRATFNERAYTSISKLLTPQAPLVKTAMYNHILPDDHFGQNVNILITTFYPRFGEEDGIIVNQRFLDMGGLSSVKYSAFPVSLEGDTELNFGEQFHERETQMAARAQSEREALIAKGVRPSELPKEEERDRYARGIINVKRKVVKTDMSGREYVAEEPVVVMPHDLLARKTWARQEKDLPAFVDINHDSLRQGFVDRIISSKSTGLSRSVYIVIRMPDNLWLGDKLASRYSQKGVIAMVVPDVDMPFDPDNGQTADLIINPQAFPSRMTVGMLAEVLVANAHVLPDKNKNVHVLFRNRGLDLYAPLERIFIVPKKLWDEYNFDNEHPHNKDESSQSDTQSSAETSPAVTPEMKTFDEFMSDEFILDAGNWTDSIRKAFDSWRVDRMYSEILQTTLKEYYDSVIIRAKNLFMVELIADLEEAFPLEWTKMSRDNEIKNKGRFVTVQGVVDELTARATQSTGDIRPLTEFQVLILNELSTMPKAQAERTSGDELIRAITLTANKYIETFPTRLQIMIRELTRPKVRDTIKMIPAYPRDIEEFQDTHTALFRQLYDSIYNPPKSNPR